MAASAVRNFSPESVRDLFSPFVRGGRQTSTVVNTSVDSGDSATCDELNEQSKNQLSSLSSTSHRDRGAYLSRVCSYSSLTWFAKPSWLCPLQCARFGWENAGSDLLQCVTCRAYMSGRNSSSMQPQVYDEYCRRLEGLLVKKHHSVCPWRTNPVPEVLMSVPVLGYSDATSLFCSTVKDLLVIGEKLPRLPWEDLQVKGLTLGHGHKLKSLYSKLSEAGGQSLSQSNEKQLAIQDETCPHPQISACVLAACGWKAKRSGLKIVVCEDCNREVGLWNFLSLGDEDKVPSKCIDSVTPVCGGVDTTETAAVHSSSSGEVANTPAEIITSNLVADKEEKQCMDSLEDKTRGTEEPAKKRVRTKDTTKTHFNPLSEHRSWCPWVASGPPKKSSNSRSLSAGCSRSSSTSSLVLAPGSNVASEGSPDMSSPPSRKNSSSSLSPLGDVAVSFPSTDMVIIDSPTVSNITSPHEEVLEKTGDWPGWNHRLESLLPDLSPHKSIRAIAKKSPRHASLRSIRQLVYEWVSPFSQTKDS